MKTISNFFVLLIISLISVQATTQNIQTAIADDSATKWAASTEIGPNASNLYDVETDSAGSIYAVGFVYANQQYDFGNNITVNGAYAGEIFYENAVIVKYNSDGQAQWAKSTEVGTNLSIYYSVTTDNQGNVYAAGEIAGIGEFDFGNNVTVNGSYDFGGFGRSAVLVKYNSDGQAQWAKSTEIGVDYSRFSGIDADSVGNIYAAGSAQGTQSYNFGNDVSVSGTSSSYNGILVKYNSDGQAQWAKSTETGTAQTHFNNVNVNHNDEPLVIGNISDITQTGFGNNVLVNGGKAASYSVLLLNYNSDGQAQWAKSLISAVNMSTYYDVAADSIGNIYTVGDLYQVGNYDFGNGVSVNSSNNTYNAVVVKYDTSGNTLWANVLPSGAESSFRGIKLLDDGLIAVAGYFKNPESADLENNISVITGFPSGNNLFTAIYDNLGSIRWARSTVSASSSSRYNAIAVDDSYHFFTAGQITGSESFDLGDGAVTHGGSNLLNPIVTKYYFSPPQSADTTAPSFEAIPNSTSVINIEEGQTISTNPYIIKVRPVDDNSISKVEFYVDEVLICTATSPDQDGIYSCYWDTSKYHSSVKVYAFDNSNNRSQVLLRNASVDPKLYLTILPETGMSLK